MPRVIALVGQAGAGKSTVAQHLVVNHGYKAVKFANILKDMMRTLGLTEREIEGDLKEVPCSLLLGATPRHAMQTLGTEWGRHFIHEDLWTHAWKVKVTDLLGRGHSVVTDDCRFKNEYYTVRMFSGVQVWRVLRKDLPEPMEHSSEEGLPTMMVDERFCNYGSIGDLKQAVDKVILSSSSPTQ